VVLIVVVDVKLLLPSMSSVAVVAPAAQFRRRVIVAPGCTPSYMVVGGGHRRCRHAVV